MANLSIGNIEKVRALAANARLLLVGGTRAAADSRLTAYDAASNKVLWTSPLPAHVLGVALSGEQFAAAGADGTVRFGSLADGAVKFQLHNAHPGGCTAVAASPDGKVLYTAGADGFVRAWDWESTKKLKEWSASSQPLRAVAVDPTHTYVACAGDDSVVRSFTVATGARRDMPGHEGAVRALAFTPRDGRLVSAGDDGKLRIGYLVGAVEFEVRGDKDSGHAGSVLGLVFPPTPQAEAGQDPAERIASVGSDGKLKVWRLDERRKPRTFELGSKALNAVAFAPPANPRQAKQLLGYLFVAGEDRRVTRITLGTDGKPTDETTAFGHGFDVFNEALKAALPRREAAVKEAVALLEPEALDFVLGVLSSDKDIAARRLAATELGNHGRTAARPKLRDRLNDDDKTVRAAALDALVKLETESPLAAPRVALDSRFVDTRVQGLRLLAKLGSASPLVPGLIASKLPDTNAEVGTAALDALTTVSPKGSTEPLKLAFERGPAALKVEVLLRASVAGLLGDPRLQPLVARALDDADRDVRRVAFAVRVLERRPLAATLEAKDEEFARTVREVTRMLTLQAKRAAGDTEAKSTTDAELAASREQLFGKTAAGTALTEADLEPLLAAMACRMPDTAVRGARVLAQLGDGRALGALLQLSREDDAAIRRETATALQALQDPRARERLVWMLDDADGDVRAAALSAVVALDSDAPLSAAEAALRSGHEDVRVRGLDRLVKLGAKAEGAEGLLGDALEDESAKVRGEAFRTLWAWNDKEPVKALDRALAGRFPDLRTRAVEVLAQKGTDDWALERLKKSVEDRDAGVATAAYEAWVKLAGKEKAEPHLAALSTPHPALREKAAKASVHAPAEAMRSALLKRVQDEHLDVAFAALEALDKLIPNENGPLLAGIAASALPVRVRASELLAPRGAEDIIEPMRGLITDKDLERMYPPAILVPLRIRASRALATLGSRRLLGFYATTLLPHEVTDLQEQGARGLATASRRGDEGALLDALGHSLVAARSWAADGLARLGDVRALPVLTGNLRHEHLPIRLGAILAFAALGHEGDGGLLHGLEDSAREVQEMVFAIVLARDLRASREGGPPDLLTSALASGRPEVRYAAARALELRTEPEAYRAHLVEVLLPPRPEKAGDMKDWPAEEERAKRVIGLAEALSSGQPEQRYAAAQVLLLRNKPLDYFREAQKVARPSSLQAPWKPETAEGAAHVIQPSTPEKQGTASATGKSWLRRLFSAVKPSEGAGTGTPKDATQAERHHLRRLAFGAYVGLLRQVTAGDEEGHRVRRDAVDRVVKLTQEGYAGTSAAVAALLRALEDPHQLVRRAALAGLKELYPAGSDEPLALALASLSPDVARAALEELAERGDKARPRVAAALNSPLPEVRKSAFELLEKLSPPGSLDPLLAALGSEHADLRVGVIERLAGANDPRVTEALGRAMGSEHEDLRLRAAELLAFRGDDRAVEVLGTFLRSETSAVARRAQEALARLGTSAAVAALAARLTVATEIPERTRLVAALGRTHRADALDVLARQSVEDEAPSVRLACVTAAMQLTWPAEQEKLKEHERELKKRDAALAVRFLRVAVKSQDPEVRKAAAGELEHGKSEGQDALLVQLFNDRDVTVRAAAVEHYSKRVVEEGAAVEPLEEILRAGARELMLPAAEGVAHQRRASALRPLLLYARAGEPHERGRALLALGTLGDVRALSELETVAGGGTPDAPAEEDMVFAAIEALGRLANRMPDGEDRRRIEEKVEAAATDGAAFQRQEAGVRGLRAIGGERARVKLEALLADGETDDDVRRTVAEELGKFGDPAAEAALAAALNEEDDDLRAAARKALDVLFPKERTRVEFLAVQSEHEDISEPAATYLASEGDPALLVPRLATLDNVELRLRLRRGLARRGAMPVPEVIALFGHDKPEAREEAARLVGTWTGDAREAGAVDTAGLTRALVAAERRTATAWATAQPPKKEPLAAAWERLLWAGSRLGAKELVATSAEILRKGEAQAPAAVRQEAARVLGRLKATSEAQALRTALGDPDAAVRAAAASVLAALVPEQSAAWALEVKPFDPVALGPTGAKVATSALTASEGRRLAVPALLAKKDVEPLKSVAADPKAEVKQDAWAALGRLGGDEAAALLKTAAFDKSQSVELRKAAYRAHKRARRAAERARKEGQPS
ncbi:WD domain-/G-beta repeat/PBS lyase HEAT-like repeat-containing protein [Corallococcus coralloides]|uniref:WD domain-/G-beta repeat/PBS lyase HEAT-like repeat-containing protein n=1 Tax=Corallococcus coralloides TaxID=184914 RepID=A0A410S4E0_CORCK|nr:HEAT repeat domain-containing protein [Corallococcus coralloides]QAT89054.1 WD domain-/G-beta repeat/PBS lyase HEAT-like repeat-containing protein [Corallococcus coralloides]